MKTLMWCAAALSIIAAVGVRTAEAQGGKKAAKEVTVTSKSPKAVAAFKKGRDLMEGQRAGEAMAELKKAVAADPEFALATATLGTLIPGPEGDALLAKATELAAKVPDAERTLIELFVAQRKGDVVKAEELREKLAELAPGDWRAQHALAQRAQGLRKFDEAIERANKALAANPKAAVVYNTLAYTYAAQRKWDDAIAAAKKQAELLPKEPNPQDTLGEILLWAGRFPEAEAGFQKALKASARFAPAWQGIAMSRFYRGDWAGGYDALAKAKEAAARPQEKIGFDVDVAWAKLAEGKTADAFAALAAAEKEAEAQKLPFYAGAALERAWLSYIAANYADAAASAAIAMERAAKGEYSGAAKENLRRGGLVVKALAEIRLGKTADAEKTMADIEGEAKKLPKDDGYHRDLSWVRGNLAAAKGDMKAAAGHYDVCTAGAVYPCMYERLMAEEKAGDRAAADKTKTELLAQYFRDPGYLVARTRLAPAKPK